VTDVKRILLAVSLTLAAGCSGDPDVDEGLAPGESSVISGDAVIAFPLADPHPVVLFLGLVADSAGAPLDPPVIADVTVIPEFVLAEGGDGVRTGPFVFGLVSQGAYVVSGIVDVDENFNLLVPELAVPTAADLRGGYANVVTGELITILVEPNQVVGEVTVVFVTPPPGS
jgi:hypothetical protein